MIPVALQNEECIFPSRDLDVPALYKTEITDENASRILAYIQLLTEDDRLMIAEDLRKKLEAFVKEQPLNQLKENIRRQMQESPLQEQLALLSRRGVECLEAAEDLASRENWTLAFRTFGFDTFVRPVGEQMYVKVEGEQEGTSIFDQLLVVREAAMYHRWGPFVCSSALVHSFKQLDLMVTFELNAPLFHRDCLMRGYACDYSEKDMILICGDSVVPADYPSLGLSTEPNGWLFKRMSITRFRCQVQLRGVNKGKVIMAALIDPRTALPQSVINFCLQRIVGVLLYLLLRTAQRLNRAGDKLGADFLQVIRRDPYYFRHCLPRILWYCQQKGWEYPVAGTMGGDMLLAGMAKAMHSVKEDDQAARAMAQQGRQSENGPGSAPLIQESAADRESPETQAKKRGKLSLRGIFRRRRGRDDVQRKQLFQVAGGSRGNASSANLMDCGEAPSRAAPTDVAQAEDMSPQQVNQTSAMQTQEIDVHQDEGVPSWTLIVVTAMYLIVRVTIVPLVRRFSGPVGEAIVLAFVLQQTLSLLLKKNVLDATALTAVGHFDLSYAFFAVSLGLSVGSLLLPRSRRWHVDLKGVHHPPIWDNRIDGGVHAINTGLFLIVMLIIVCQHMKHRETRLPPS